MSEQTENSSPKGADAGGDAGAAQPVAPVAADPGRAEETDGLGLRAPAGADVGAGVAVGSLAAAVVGCLVLRFAYQGLAISDVGDFANMLVIVMFAICSAIAFRKTWEGFTRRPTGSAADSLRSLKMIGFVGSLLAYFFRSLIEAPGEKLHREEYETARSQYEKRRSTRTGNPAARKAKAGKAKRK